MWEIGSFVKVMSKTISGGKAKELIPIGTICKIKEVCQEDDGTPYYGITPIDREDVPFYYLEKELEKGQLVWVPDVPYKVGHNFTDKYGHYKTEYLGTYESKKNAFDAAKKLEEKLPKEGEDGFDCWENYFVRKA